MKKTPEQLDAEFNAAHDDDFWAHEEYLDSNPAPPQDTGFFHVGDMNLPADFWVEDRGPVNEPPPGFKYPGCEHEGEAPDFEDLATLKAQA